MFLIGTDELLPCGFEVKPSLRFTESDRMPESSTCTITLTLSLVHNTKSLRQKWILQFPMDLALVKYNRCYQIIKNICNF